MNTYWTTSSGSIYLYNSFDADAERYQGSNIHEKASGYVEAKKEMEDEQSAKALDKVSLKSYIVSTFLKLWTLNAVFKIKLQENFDTKLHRIYCNHLKPIIWRKKVEYP